MFAKNAYVYIHIYLYVYIYIYIYIHTRSCTCSGGVSERRVAASEAVAQQTLGPAVSGGRCWVGLTNARQQAQNVVCVNKEADERREREREIYIYKKYTYVYIYIYTEG